MVGEAAGIELVVELVPAVATLEADTVVGVWVLDGDNEIVVERDFVETFKLEYYPGSEAVAKGMGPGLPWKISKRPLFDLQHAVLLCPQQ